MPTHHTPTVHRLEAVTAPQLQSLAELLIDAVDGGASVSFMHPLPVPRALAFWPGWPTVWPVVSGRCLWPKMLKA